MISNELSTIQSKNADRDMIAQALAGYLAKGNVIDCIPIMRSHSGSGLFNGAMAAHTDLNPDLAEIIAKDKKKARAVKIERTSKTIAREDALAKKIEAYVELGVVIAAKDLHLSAKRVSYLADLYGIKFVTRRSPVDIEAEAKMIPVIRQRFVEGLNQADIVTQLGISRTTMRRLCEQAGIKFRDEAAQHRDLKLVERIKAVRDLGCTRAQCARRLDLDPKTMRRLIEEYQIPYPLKHSVA
jgi:DNA-binding XRE family transcriptional regulator